MKESLIEHLEFAVNKAVNYIHVVYNKNSIGSKIPYNTRRETNEVLESLYLLSSLKIIQPIDDAIICGIFRIGQEVIFEKLLHFGNYYYAKQKLFHGSLYDKEEILRRTNVETSSMLSRIRAFQLSIDNIGGSTDDYFIERMPQLLDGISYVIKTKQKEIYIPALYNLLNLHKTIYFYYQSKHTSYLAKIKLLHSRVVRLINNFTQLQDFNDIICNNPTAKFFYGQYVYFENNLTGDKTSLPSLDLDNFLELRLQPKLRVLYNLSVLDNERFIKYFKETFSEIQSAGRLNIVDNAIIIRLISIYLSKIKENELIDINVKSGIENIQISDDMDLVFNKINQISNISITEEDLEKLNNYNDSELRERVAKTLINVSSYEIEREMQKPHGVFEISDMEIRIKIRGKLVYLCMPFKTGKEIKAGSVSVDVFYQLLRPFFHFNNCVVVFITAKKCSQNLVNEIKRAHDKYGFSIEILESRQLAKLLKLNGQLN